MWISHKLIELFSIGRETVDGLRTDLKVAEAKVEILERELAASKIGQDWLRVRLNEAEAMKVALTEKVYAIKLPVPQLIPQPTPAPSLADFSFEDVGDEAAKRLGLPVYGN